MTLVACVNKGLPAAVLVIGLSLLSSSAAAQAGAKKSDAVVKASATATEPGADGKQVLTLTLQIEDGWHLYANPTPPDFPGIPTTVTIDKVRPQDLKVEYPPGKLVKDAVVGDHQVYEGKVTIKAVVQRARGEAGPLDVNVRVQACTDKQCLLPGTIKLTVGK
jgi:DsbC/DsbD-like thiol-disulfide interchange protein